MERITSRQNPLAVRIRKLNTSRAFRRQTGEFTGEGPKLLAEAVKAGADLRAVIAEEGSSFLPPLSGVRTVEVSSELLCSLCDTKTPQGVLFLCANPLLEPPERLTGHRYIVLDGVQDPGNVGTIWRTADALGADGLILVNGCADPFSPKTVRATMGACFRLPICETDENGLMQLLAQSEIPLFATALGGDTEDLRKADLTRAAVLIGSEGRGISDGLLRLSDRCLKIPMRDRCESLNAAAAAAVILWEMAR